MRKFDPLHEPTADKSALKCFDHAYLTEMTRLGTQSVVRVEEISKKEVRNNTFKLLKGSPSGKMTDCLLLYIVLLKRGLIVLRPGPHECDILNLGIVFFFFFFLFFLVFLFCFVFFLPRFVRTELLRVVWRAVSKRCGFGELNQVQFQFRPVKKNICVSKNIRIGVNRA